MTERPATSVDDTPVRAPEGEGTPPSISFAHALWALLLSVVVLLVIGYFTYEPDVFRRLVSHMNPWYLIAAVATVALRVGFGGWRLHYVSGGRLDLRSSLRGQLAWDFFSNVTPSAIGGAPVAAFYIAKDARLRMGESTAVVLFSLLLDQLWFAFSIPVLFVASLYLEVFPPAVGNVGAWMLGLYFLGMLTWTLLFAYATLVRLDVLEKLADWIFQIKWLRRFRGRVQREMHQLRRRAQVLRTRPPRFFVNGFLLTAGTWISRYLTLLFIVWSVYAGLDQLLLLFRTAGMMLCALVMPTPGGSGGIEGLYALFIGPLMPQAVVVPTLITWRILAYYVFLAFGVYLAMHQMQRTLHQHHTDDAETAAPSPDGTSASSETAHHATR